MSRASAFSFIGVISWAQAASVGVEEVEGEGAAAVRTGEATGAGSVVVEQPADAARPSRASRIGATTGRRVVGAWIGWRDS
ncbi:hypothetical protein Smic_70290 [Streptomyces microflavus]|uniref:Uncharacterized protein n=1 Tax=Streptomyces microflavus TaxID=1919 RepID=A0A7J0D158_STRMI|nr:hypothetical protein Smic_70290 [Streptomyces microflavus]